MTGRLGIEEIATLGVGARVPPLPLPLTLPISFFLVVFEHVAFVSKKIHAPEENASTAGYVCLYNSMFIILL